MKKALVTGASSGLGAALAQELSKRGFHVVGLDRIAPDSEAVNLSVICDLADREDLNRTLSVIATAGPYALVFMNAGVSATGRFEDIPIEAQLALLHINLEAPIVLTNALLNSNALQGPICFVSSLSHFTGYPGAATYAASKDGLAAYAKSLAKVGIKITIAYPGPLDTMHAARHAPQGAKANMRMKPDVAAKFIVEATIAGKKVILPGYFAKILSVFGQLFPNTLTKMMRKALYEKLDKSVY